MNAELSPGQLFAVTKGTYLGKTYVLMNSNKHDTNFLCLTSMENITIKTPDVTEGISNDILELLETLPQDIMITCEQQYEKNLNSR